jgi:hypothetical protein
MGEYGVASTKYDEDLYSRVAVLCSGALQQMGQKIRKTISRIMNTECG